MKDKSKLRIGLIADTHEAENPLELISRLGARHCDLHIHLGDIGGSRLASKFVHEFKQTLGNVDHLCDEDRRRFESLKDQGLSPLWAYIETKLGDDSASRERRIKEARQSYVDIMSAMGELPNTVMVSGNIDRSLMQAAIVADLCEYPAPLVVEPQLLEIGRRALVLWPSIKHADLQTDRKLEELVDSFLVSVSNKRQIVVFAHEQIYRGPSPRKYKRNVERAGYRAMTVPHYEPNPSWRQLLRLFRSLRPSQGAGMVYGHVHDPHHVIQAGAPYLRGTVQEGLSYRLYGLGSHVKSDDSCSDERRTIRLFTIPVDSAAILHLTPGEMRLEILA